MWLPFTILLGLTSASVIPRYWCPGLIAECKKSVNVISGSTCLQVAAANSISLNTFYDLNPSIDRSDCHNMYAKCDYCVSTDLIIPPTCPTDYDSNCDTFYTVQSGDICNTIVSKYLGLNLSEFYKLNPSVDTVDCRNLIPSCDYCVHAPPCPTTIPNPHQPNIRIGCIEYYRAVPGDNCWKISQDRGINLDNILAWNPDVGPQCLNMLAGYYYCLGT